MKLRENKKEKLIRNAEKQQRSKKIGRIFNPTVRVLQYTLTAFVVYFIVTMVAMYVVPVIGGMLASVIDMSALDTWISLLTLWGMPYLFVAGLLFIGVLWLIKRVAAAIGNFADNLISEYRTRQERVNSTAEKSDSK